MSNYIEKDYDHDSQSSLSSVAERTAYMKFKLDFSPLYRMVNGSNPLEGINFCVFSSRFVGDFDVLRSLLLS